MAVKSPPRMLVRQWQLVLELAANRYGLTIRQLIERGGASKQTVYRDLLALRAAGVPLVSRISNGEARHRLLRDVELPELGLTALQVSALHLARAELEPLAGSAFVAELDAFLSKLRPAEPQHSFRFATKAVGHPHVVRLVERAIRTKRRARIEYRAVSRGGASSVVHVEPLLLRVSDGNPYFRAYCVERAAERTYKIARVVKIELTDEAATHVPRVAADEAYAGAVKTWSGDLTTVRISLDPDVAWLAVEYPLVRDQRVEPSKDGGVVIEARVAGVIEAARWVLSWGGAAEALAPLELRKAVRAELARALEKYDRPGPAKAARRKAAGRATGRLMQGGTGRA